MGGGLVVYPLLTASGKQIGQVLGDLLYKLYSGVVVTGRSTGEKVSPVKRQAYIAARVRGLSKLAASKEAGISRPTGRAIEERFVEEREEQFRGRNRSIGSSADADIQFQNTSSRTMAAGRAGHGNPWANGYARLLDDADLPGPVPFNKLCSDARAALDDFGLFRRRYLGRGHSPWQEDAAIRLVGLLEKARETRDREFAVVNAPPGSGKSTLFTHDLSVWLICRDRRIRILVGSRTANQAMKYTRRIRRSLTQRDLLMPKEEDLRAGLAVVPHAVLLEDFGRFQPLGRGDDVWQMGGFTVEQHGGVLTGEKEPTVTAFGFDSDYLGMRVDLAAWDDLVDLANVRTLDVIENLQEMWDSVAEMRPDPGGLNLLQGQRLKHNDLYRYNLDKRRARDEEDDDVVAIDAIDAEFTPKYHHIVYRAHDESACRGLHKRSDPPWRPDASVTGEVLRGLFGYRIPESGCLLDPRRLPWRDLRTLMEEDPDTFRVVYQQEDLDPGSALVQKIWVDGGRDDNTGALYQGCWDHDRGQWQLPPANAMAPPNHVAVVIDPSPSNWWACQLWLYNHASEKRYLLAAERKRMQAPELVDWNHDRAEFTGFLEEWWHRATAMALPFRYVVVEVNTAQKWLLQYDHAKRWATKRGVTFVAHTTGVHKTDEKRGIPAVKGHWRSGRIRLPGRPDGSRAASELLVREVLRWPHGATDDQVLAHWFFEFTLPKLSPRVAPAQERTWRPSWSSGWRDTLAG